MIVYQQPHMLNPKPQNQEQFNQQMLAPLNSMQLKHQQVKQSYQQPQVKQNNYIQNQSSLSNHNVSDQQQKKKQSAQSKSKGKQQESQQEMKQQHMLQDERLETYESMRDVVVGMSPRTKAVNKIIKHIKKSFYNQSAAPSTTVDFYRIGKVLGKGAFGKVNLAVHRLSESLVAVKSINKQYFSEESQTKKVMQEVVILKKTRHRNIVRLYEFFETQKHILFVIELCAGGDLLNYVRKRRKLKEDVAKCIFKQIIMALGYCHSKSILHRDIKLDNILLDSNGEVKICDFGVSKIVKKDEIITEQCGTPAYIAPEILRDRGYTGFAVDIWSAGVVLYAMLFGTVPFKAGNMSDLQKIIMKAKYSLKEDISDSAKDLIKGLLEKEPEKRLKISQILKHKWLEDAKDSVDMFTQAEKDYIKSDFTYNDTKRLNRNNNLDNFTEHVLDTVQNSFMKNQETKSVILAPFNSTRIDFRNNLKNQNSMAGTQSQGFEMSDSIKELLESKRIIKFAARCRDIDRQYEINNNADLDNGVYHKYAEEEENKQNEENKEGKKDDDSENVSNLSGENKGDKKKKSKTELEKLEDLIQQEEKQNNVENENYMVSDGNNLLLNIQDMDQDKDKELGKKDEGGLQNMHSVHSENHLHDISMGHGSNLNALFGGNSYMLTSQQTLIIDEQLVAKVESFGYPKEFVLKCLNNSDLNYATTSYFLLQHQQKNPNQQINPDKII